uniref:Uncharacterized protein n=1 Tax=Opuntia streptacantha TaxID=393608 RepID=A0A7C8ZXA0_OPUST
MGFSDRHQTEGGLESKNMKWVIAGIPVRAQLKTINTTKSKVRESEDELVTTPTSREARIPEKLPCPPAPRKCRPSTKSKRSSNNLNHAGEFFILPDFDLDSVFARRG